MLRRTVGILALSGALIGFVTSLLLPRRYIGRASLAVDSRESIEGAAERTLSAQPLSVMIGQSPYYKTILDYTPVQELVQQIRDNSAIVAQRHARCTVEFTDDNRYAALDMTNSLLAEMTKNLGGARLEGPVRVGKTGPSNALCTLEGLVAGLAAGLCVWFAAGQVWSGE